MRRINHSIMVAVLILVGCEDILEEPDISGQTVTILAPMDDSILTTNTVGFHWEIVEDATSYNVQIATPNFENAIQLVLDSVVAVDTLGQVTTRIDKNLKNGTYQWRIKAFNSGFKTGYTLTSFQVNGNKDLDLVPPNIPQPTAPANEIVQAESEVNFSWIREEISGTAERDSIFIFTDDSLQILVTKALGANKAYSTILAEGTYYWFVQAFDTAGNESDISKTFNFTIGN
ncbi:hypothetical protein HME9304_02732 [Flagellimonas maritima]|uniref:Fibronectin type-III domain-containing protein n=1 Tax=Flagellimonas maritima TaxID=1383885 RepID=A0A2Z4LUX0_9FLAO|nr:hypothetical protein [Allomuricauda aurantiaca]AWX45705.1 hypothetical protein HME9304_02732 [Allomuricauda aurantiaca]